MPFRYTLQPYKGRNSRYICPQCNHTRRTFKRYIDTTTQTHLADHVGKCDRIDSCGYHCTPHDYFASNGGNSTFTNSAAIAEKPFDTLPRRYVEETTKAYHRNNFILFLTRCFDEATALRLAAKYKIGTSKHWPGATIYWQIDVNDNVRTGKIMLYNFKDGHRVKVPFNHIAWVHVLSQNSKVKSQNKSDIKHPKSEFNLKQCFFGEHLLSTDPFAIVAIAESEKTAVVCSFYYPEYIWLAAGSLEGLSLGKCKVLKDRRVILYPDLNGYDKWSVKAREFTLLMAYANFTTDDTLERTALPEEREKGLDMADRWLDQITKLK